MTYNGLPFQYQSEKATTKLTGFAGLPLYIELLRKSGVYEAIPEMINTKERGWTDREMLLSIILLNLAGGDCISDIERLEQDAGLRELLQLFSTQGMKRAQRRRYLKRFRKEKNRGLPSKAAIHRFLQCFHSEEEEGKRVEGKAFIPEANAHLQALSKLNALFIATGQTNEREATLDQDATLVETYKRNALYCYKKHKAYQPFNTYWAEPGMILHSEFRDGNVPAGYEQLRCLQYSLSSLPERIKKAYLRSDSAGYQQELLEYCAEGKDERFGKIEFAIAIKVSAEFKSTVKAINESVWQPLCKTDNDGVTLETTQEWAEVCFVPNWAANSKRQADYRFIAIREKMTPDKSGEPIDTKDLPFQTIQANQADYKLFGLVTNRTLPGNALINWHRERCGDSEQVHSAQKTDFAGGQLPSNTFGVNAAWWQIMVLSYNLNRLMQIIALPKPLKQARMKAIRFHVIQFPGRVIYHARRYIIRIEHKSYKLFQTIRNAVEQLTIPVAIVNTS